MAPPRDIKRFVNACGDWLLDRPIGIFILLFILAATLAVLARRTTSGTKC
jgi:hypothetical protein